MDRWHGILIGAITTLATVIGVLWRAYVQQSRRHEKALADLNAEHKDDIRELMQATIELGQSVLAQRRLPRGSDPSQPPSE